MSVETFYNINFNVKYHEIETELKTNFNSSAKTSNEEQTNNEHYTYKDIDDICHKLYRDEFCSVFNTDTIFDDKIDVGIHKLREKMKENKEFSDIMREIKFTLLENKTEQIEDDNDDNDYIIFLSFFCYNIFHVMHKIICEFILTETISNNLLDKLKSLVMNELKYY